MGSNFQENVINVLGLIQAIFLTSPAIPQRQGENQLFKYQTNKIPDQGLGSDSSYVPRHRFQAPKEGCALKWFGQGGGGGFGLLENPQSQSELISDLSFCRAKVTFKNIGDRRSRRKPPFSAAAKIFFFAFLTMLFFSKKFPLKLPNHAGELSHFFQLLIFQGKS